MFGQGKETDKTWEYYGKTNPYFGVLTDERFKTDSLTADAKEAFFESGQRYVDFLFEALQEFVGPFRAKRALDFGCGVGRITLPLAKKSGSAVGIDVSQSMLGQARENSAARGVSNTTFVHGDDTLSGVTGAFDFLHSFIVFQHIPPRRGEAIVKKLIELLEDDGVGALHFTFAYGSSTPVLRRVLTRAYKVAPVLYGVRNIVKGRPFSEPMMQMNEYDLNRLLRILAEAGCHRVQVRFTETGVFGQVLHGAVILFQKRRTDVSAHG